MKYHKENKLSKHTIIAAQEEGEQKPVEWDEVVFEEQVRQCFTDTLERTHLRLECSLPGQWHRALLTRRDDYHALAHYVVAQHSKLC